MDGIFNIDKAVGMTSHDVVARVRRLTRQKRVGHAGTLDPAASGVLPICLGQATRVAEYLSESGKRYRAIVVFGTVTDTYDAEGVVVRSTPVHLTREQIASALPEFLGRQMQLPPLYSAIKSAGQPLYKLARAGIEAPRQARPVEIFELDFLDWQAPALTLEVECSKGTYIRSLAYDLGERLGCGAYLGGLVRLRSGPFTLEESLTLEELAQALEDGSWPNYFYAPDEALLDRMAVILGPVKEKLLMQGQNLHFPALALLPTLPAASAEAIDAESAPERESEAPLLRAYSTDGRFLAILRWQAAVHAWHPHKVLTSASVE